MLDYFAGQANEADIQCWQGFRQCGDSVTRPTRSRLKARWAFAQAMLAEKRRLEKED